MSELKSTLRVFNEAELDSKPGPYARQARKRLVGCDERPSERLLMNSASFEPGAHVDLHWHPTEGIYYVISGRADMTDIEGNTCEIGPGSVIYVTPGIASSHEWKVKERLQILIIRATTERENGSSLRWTNRA